MLRRLAFFAAKRAIKDGLLTAPSPSAPLRSTAVGSAQRLEIRPAITTQQQLFKITPILAVAVVGGFVLRSGVAGLVISIVVVTVIVALIVNVRKRSRVVITPREITQVSLLGLRRSRPRSAVATVLSAPLMTSSPGQKRAHHNVFVLNAAGRPIVRLKDTVWALDDMKRVVKALDVQPVGPGKAVPPHVLAASYPKVLRFYERYPWVTQIAGGLALVGSIVAAITLI